MRNANGEAQWLCLHMPRKEWRNRLPIRLSVIVARTKKEALSKFVPFHPNDPNTTHYNKPLVTIASGTYHLD